LNGQSLRLLRQLRQLDAKVWEAARKSAPMDLSGRFNFWRVLILTRAITPPRMPARHWPEGLTFRRGGWSLLGLGAILAAGVVVRLSQSDWPVQIPAVDPPPISTAGPCAISSALVRGLSES
jgi:hypothetical protein